MQVSNAAFLAGFRVKMRRATPPGRQARLSVLHQVAPAIVIAAASCCWRVSAAACAGDLLLLLPSVSASGPAPSPQATLTLAIPTGERLSARSMTPEAGRRVGACSETAYLSSHKPSSGSVAGITEPTNQVSQPETLPINNRVVVNSSVHSFAAGSSAGQSQREARASLSPNSPNSPARVTARLAAVVETPNKRIALQHHQM